MVVKIINCDFGDEDSAGLELKISQRIKQANPSHEGISYVRTIIDSFQVSGPHGTHVCLLYEPMREHLYLFERRCRNGRFPLDLIRAYLRLLLTGLDYLHSECHIIHTGRLTAMPILLQTEAHSANTDIKLDNIMVGIEDSSVIENFARAQAENPMPRKVQDGRTVYLSHNDFGPIRSKNILPKIADFGLAQFGESGLQRHPTQQDFYRAPEVILGAGWTYSADIWNLGVLVRFDFHMNYSLLTRRDKDLESTGKERLV